MERSGQRRLGIFDLPVAYLNYDFDQKLWYDKNDKYSRIINKKIKLRYLLK